MPKKSKNKNIGKNAAKKLRPKTLEIHGGGSVSDLEIRPGLHRVIGFSLGSFERAKRLFAGAEEGFIYTRVNKVGTKFGGGGKRGRAKIPSPQPPSPTPEQVRYGTSLFARPLRNE